MSEKKEEKGQAATDRLKAAALSAAKGLSRTQAEKAANAATRNVNAYGQKEEGPSRWQERKEMKRQMYLMSTEKQVRLGVRKDPKASVASTGGVASQCQKCFQGGHWTYECKNERVYISRPSRSQILKNPKLRQKMMPSYTEEDNPDIIKEQEDDEEKKKDEKVEKRKKKKKSKRKYKSDTESELESESSGSGSDESGSSHTSSSASEEERSRKKDKRKQEKGRRRKSKRYSSSSDSETSDSESSPGSDSEGGKRRKSGKHTSYSDSETSDSDSSSGSDSKGRKRRKSGKHSRRP